MEGLLKSQSSVESSLARESDESGEENEEEKQFQVQHDSRMTSIVQDALCKRDEAVTLLAER